MASLDEVRSVRKAKKELLALQGVASYPSTSERTHEIVDVIAAADGLEAAATEIIIAGRIMSLRPQGALIFGHLFDGSGTFQFLYKKDDATADRFDLFERTTDIADFIEVTGTVFTTKRGEKTVSVRDWRMLTKSLAPLPDKWHGLQDQDEIYRKRYLDILLNPDVRGMIERKSKFWASIRGQLATAGFIEVETPTLELTTGGAEARPFKTHHNDYDLEVFLRISVGELWQKRLLAGGLPRTFEIGRAFRNEGTSPEHAQEFTNMEFYAAYWDYKKGMEFTERLIKEAAQATFGKLAFESRGFSFDLSGKWPVIDYVGAVKEKTGVDVLKASEEEMRKALDSLGVKYEGINRERLTDTLWKYCRKQIAGPAWLINHPKLVSPLSKASKENPELTERCQLLLAGSETVNGFSELNDPVDQQERFDAQQQLIDRGDEEAMMPDVEFVEMLEHGMPPAFGMGFGDRLFAILEGRPLRDTHIFPLMRPKHEHKNEEKEESDK